MAKLLLKSFLRSYWGFSLAYAGMIGVLLFFGYLCLAKFYKRDNTALGFKTDILRGLVFTFYMLFLICGMLLNREINVDYGVRLELFWSYRRLLTEYNEALMWQIVYNVIVFIPWGIVFPQFWKCMRTWGRVVASSFVFALFVELVQLLFKCGLFEFDDLFHNVLGAVIGYGIWKLFQALRRKRVHE